MKKGLLAGLALVLALALAAGGTASTSSGR